MKYKKPIILTLSIFLCIGLGWAWSVNTYIPKPPTNNILLATDSPLNTDETSNNTLLDIEIDSGEDILSWAETSISIKVDGEIYPCSVTGTTSNFNTLGKIQTILNADGTTFAIQIDASSEDEFVKLDFSTMQESIGNNFTVKFSKTDIYFGEEVEYSLITGGDFFEINNSGNNTFSKSDERLDWYDYDLTHHRVIPKSQIYLIKDNNLNYKLKIIDYYNETDSPRQIKILTSLLSNEPHPSLNNSDLIITSPCIINNSGTEWTPNQKISISENGIDICNKTCDVTVLVYYKGINVKGTLQLQVK